MKRYFLGLPEIIEATDAGSEKGPGRGPKCTFGAANEDNCARFWRPGSRNHAIHSLCNVV